MDKLISVLLPSRERFDWLCESLMSLHNNCDNPDTIEYLVKLDTDDIKVISKLHEVPSCLNVKYLISNRGGGYRDIHLFCNDLCKLSTGKWLFIFNDDARMMTKGWDSVIKNIDPYKYNKNWQGSTDICLINPSSTLSDYSPIFPIMSRKGYEILGHFSLHHHQDSYIQHVFSRINTDVDCTDIRIHHLNNDISDATRAHSLQNQDVSLFHKHDNEMLMKNDREKLLTYLGRPLSSELKNV